MYVPSLRLPELPNSAMVALGGWIGKRWEAYRMNRSERKSRLRSGLGSVVIRG